MTSPRLDAAELYAEHADFVWRSLQRLGVKDPDLEDVLQEVFIVVHQQLASFEGRSKPTTWLFGISMRVASNHRRRAHRRREQPTLGAGEELAAEGDPETDTLALHARRQIDAALDCLELDKRAAFVMFEIDGLSCPEIADVMGVPVGTIYSRLYAARADLQKALTRLAARPRRAEGES